MKIVTPFVHVLAIAAAVTGCAPGAVGESTAAEEEEPAVTSAAEPLVASSFLFQHPFFGQPYTHTCDFNTTSCYEKGKYHTAYDESAPTSTAIRASNFGIRSLRQNMSASDHGMGNAVAVQHLLADGTFIYATDNHMSSHQWLAARPDGQVVVPRGAKLGQVGGSGYGSPTFWGNHDHHEMKTTNSFGSSCGATFYGYTPTSALGYCYKNPGDYFNKKAVLMPEFGLADAGWGDYDVIYGVANTPVYARLNIQQSSATYANVGVGGRAGWTSTVADFPMVSNLAPGSWAVTASRTFPAGDYRFFGAVQSGSEWRTGFPVIFSIVSKAADFVRDNDQPSAYFQSGGFGPARSDGYLYGANAATGNSGAWARWFTQRAGTYSLWVYVGGGGNGSARFKIYPTGSGTPIYTDPVNMGAGAYGWVQLRVGATTAWSFTTAGYVGLSADAGSASDVYLFDAIKFVAP